MGLNFTVKRLRHSTPLHPPPSKWHLGARSTAHLPINRGFDSHLGFLKGGEDHYTQGSTDGDLSVVDLWQNDGPAYGRNGTYSAYLYTAEAMRVINQHDASSPLFLYLPFQVTHNPLEAPKEFIKPVPNDPSRGGGIEGRFKTQPLLPSPRPGPQQDECHGHHAGSRRAERH